MICEFNSAKVVRSYPSLCVIGNNYFPIVMATVYYTATLAVYEQLV
jgi:hypothetical protein